MTRGDIIRQTQIYWVNTQLRGLDPGSASMGLRYGMLIALSHPDYARAYADSTHRPEADKFQHEAIKEFMAAVPMMTGEDKSDVTLN